MPIEFTSFPANWRLPLYWVEVDPSQAGTAIQVLPALLVGQMITAGRNAGSATLDVPIPVGDLQSAQGLFGLGSMMYAMVNRFFAGNSAQILWCLPIDDPAGARASGTITVTSAPQNSGTLALYIAAQKMQIAIGATDSEATVAENIVAAINGTGTLPVTASLQTSGGNIITLECNWVGLSGNDIDVRDTYLGSLGGEALPQGLMLQYSGGGKLAGGTGTPVFTTGIANLGDELFEYVALPYTDQGSLNAWQTEYGFTQSGRWGWMRQLYGQIYSAMRGAAPSPGYAPLLTFGETQNAPQTSIMVFETNSPSPVWEWAAAYCAQAAMGFSNDPARPLQTLELVGILPAPKHQRFTLTENNGLASFGLATQQVDSNGVPAILRETSTYQLNLYGSPDDAYSDMTTLATLSRLFRNQRAAITSKFPRVKLADDGTLFGPGQAIVTPSIIKAEIVSEYAQDEFNGLVEDASIFAKNLIIERDSINPDRVNVLYPPNLVAQLRIFAVLAQFRLLGQEQTTTPQQ